ncbi:MAG: hypothetical protein ACI4B9_05510 [Eggerthellaceae bacterium]
MTLVITLLAAVVATLVWYAKTPDTRYHIGTLALMYWGAALMWVVDGIACLIEGEAFIEIVDTAAMIDDALLGAVVVVAGMAAWLIYLLAKDPKGTFSKALAE